MIRNDVYDVIPPGESVPPNSTSHCIFQAQFVKLSDVVAEAVDKVFNCGVTIKFNADDGSVSRS